MGGYKDGRFGHARRIVRTEKFRDDDESDDREIVNAVFLFIIHPSMFTLHR